MCYFNVLKDVELQKLRQEVEKLRSELSRTQQIKSSRQESTVSSSKGRSSHSHTSLPQSSASYRTNSPQSQTEDRFQEILTQSGEERLVLREGLEGSKVQSRDSNRPPLSTSSRKRATDIFPALPSSKGQNSLSSNQTPVPNRNGLLSSSVRSSGSVKSDSALLVKSRQSPCQTRKATPLERERTADIDMVKALP